MSNLIIVAHIIAKNEHVEHVTAELKKLIAPTRAEVGCLQYDLHIDNNNPCHFMFYECWGSRSHWQTHLDSPHSQAFGHAVKDELDNVTIHEMSIPT